MLCLSSLFLCSCLGSSSDGGTDAGVGVDSGPTDGATDVGAVDGGDAVDAGFVVDGGDAGGAGVDGGFVCPDGRISDGTEGSPCLFATPCAEGLACNLGCTDYLDVCFGECHDEDDENAFCRQGRCTHSVGVDGGVPLGGCDESERCEADGFCYPAEF